MNRRQFFASTIGAALAAALPWKKKARPVEWAVNTTGLAKLVADQRRNAKVGGINRVTFKFWRSTDGPQRHA